ncbi:tetratricopeptide repeat protein [Herpetosiphon geysericola]|uniref:Uncharacterized protein n=1 Tax=Herpetosiphon geysericola TaxID=70996 RepID=A0A0P6Y9L9_9CHLR|nr:tetratricopeptide repeat protein [Herpetosiphon geysericola]KPL86656.1 hypothetical protein SE18_11720 [Herpetosiphon geysericola]
MTSKSKQLIVWVGNTGAQRTEAAQAWLAQQSAARTWLLSMNRANLGHWAGLNSFVSSLLPEIKAQAPELLVKYDYELALVLPQLQRELAVRNPSLTDISNPQERTRNYAADRAFRIVQGLIDMLHEFRQHTPDQAWVIVCDQFDQAGSLVTMFFKELLRRADQRFGLTIGFLIEPNAELLADYQSWAEHVEVINGAWQADQPVAALDPAEAKQQLDELERDHTFDPIEIELHLPQLIQLATAANEPRKRLGFMHEGLSICSTRGLYADALYYGEPLQVEMERDFPKSVDFRLSAYLKLYNCYIGLKQAEPALAIAETAVSITDNPARLFSWYYLIAMIHGRFAVPRDYDQAEHYLNLGIEAIQQADIPAQEKLFQSSFNRNGLALIRHFQKRPLEAIEICQECYKQLETGLDTEEHKLHRSVLLYNIAQVYDSLKDYQNALHYYTLTIEMDPNYAEYYNERANIYLQIGDYAAAERDYRQSIELSPPYTEVWTNLAQCYQLQDEFEQAVGAFSRALDIDPKNVVALNHRAECYEALGQTQAAIDDYSDSLRLKPSDSGIVANRAILYYELGDLVASLADLNTAIELQPDLAELYENRAVALEALERYPEAEHDRQQAILLANAHEVNA